MAMVVVSVANRQFLLLAPFGPAARQYAAPSRLEEQFDAGNILRPVRIAGAADVPVDAKSIWRNAFAVAVRFSVIASAIGHCTGISKVSVETSSRLSSAHGFVD